MNGSVVNRGKPCFILTMHLVGVNHDDNCIEIIIFALVPVVLNSCIVDSIETHVCAMRVKKLSARTLRKEKKGSAHGI